MEYFLGHRENCHQRKPVELTVQGPLCIRYKKPCNVPILNHKSSSCSCKCNAGKYELDTIRKTICRKRCRPNKEKCNSTVLKLAQLSELLSESNKGKGMIVYPDSSENCKLEEKGDTLPPVVGPVADSKSEKNLTSSLKAAETKQVSFVDLNPKPSVNPSVVRKDPNESILPSKSNITIGIKTEKINTPYYELGLVEYRYEHQQCLPWGFIWLAWCFSVIVIIICSVLCIYYGYFAGWEKSKGWCYSLAFAVIESMLILQPIKCIIAYVIHLCRHRKRVS